MLTKIIITLLPSLLLSNDTRVLDLFIASEHKGTYLFLGEKNLISDEIISFGKCKSKSLDDLGTYEIKDDEKIYLIPKTECLKKEIYSFNKQEVKHYRDSKSAYLNYSLVKNRDSTSATVGNGIFAYDTFFYAQGRFETGQESKLENYYVTKDISDNKLKAGSIYTPSGSYLTEGYSLQGLQFTKNNLIKTNQKSFDYQLIINNQSTIEIYNNNQLVQKITLSAGIYNLKDLPLTYSSNDIKLVITDSYGMVEERKIPFIFSSSILEKEDTDFNFAAGLDQFQEFQFSGFYRNGLTENFTGGFAFDSKRISAMADYLTELGKFGLQIDSDFNIASDYSYSKQDAYISILNTFKNQKNDFRLDTGITNDDYGNLSLSFHDNGQTFYGLNYSKTLQSNLNIALNGNYNDTKDTYSIGLNLMWNFGINNKRVNLALSNTMKNESNNKYISASLPMTQTNRGVEAYGSYENINSNHEQNNNYKLNLRGKYFNNIWINTQKNNNETSNEIGLSGSVGCVFSNSSKCAAGDTIYSESSYLIDDSELKYIPPYHTSEAKNEYTTIPITLKPGQGYWLDPSLYKNITGTINLNNKTLDEQTFIVDGKEYFTGTNGEFWIENFVGTDEQFLPKIQNAICSSKIMIIDKELYEAQINCEEI